MRERSRIVRIYTDSGYSIGRFGTAGRKCRHRGWKNSKNKEAANVDLLQLAMAWRQAYGGWFELVLSKPYACLLLKTLGAQVAVARAVARKPHKRPPFLIGPCAATPTSAALCKV